MEKISQRTADKYIKERGRKKRWHKVVTVMAAAVVFCTTYALIMPAVTQQGQAFCGHEEHKAHTEDCYKTTQVLTCDLPESDHVHSDDCYTEQRVLSCDIPETEGHLHDESCFTEDGTLHCGKSECEPHHHSDSCYTTEKVCTCGLEEQTPHKHSAECYTTEKTLVCQRAIHEHTLQCFSNPKADIETEPVWKRDFQDIKLSKTWADDVIAIATTQIGYAESSKNYQVQADGVTMNGYSRYGDWYGIPYGDWCAMFCSFCMHYAGVDPGLMPMEAGCEPWIEKLSNPELNLYRPAHNEKLPDEAENESEIEANEEADAIQAPEEEKYIPTPGDLIFFDWDKYEPEHPEKRGADHVGFVAELIYDKETNQLTKIRTIEGNWSDKVCSNYYSVDDDKILGYGVMPENPEKDYTTIVSAPASDGAVAEITGNLPQGAEAMIDATELSNEELVAYFGEERAENMKGFSAYDIKIMVDGEEWQPDKTVNVVVKQNGLTASENEGFAVAHVDDETREVANLSGKLDENGDIRFSTDGFSLYIFYTFTVDFHYGDISFSMNGMDSILLSELFKQLGIEHTVDEVVSVTFSNSDLLQVSALADGDWNLTSLQAFNSEEELTIQFSDGTGLIIAVTDAQVDSNSRWELVKSTGELSAGDTYVIVGTRSSTYYLMGANNTTASATRVSLTRQSDGSYTLTTVPTLAQQWTITANGSALTVRNIGNSNYLRLNNNTILNSSQNTVTGTYTSESSNTYGGYWRFSGNSNYLVCGTDSFSRSKSTSNSQIQILRLKPTDIVWCYHNGASTPYAKYGTLHDATVENADLRDGDIIELHGDTSETKQTVIQKSITVKSETDKNYTVDFGTSSNDFTYIAIPCNKHADPNVGQVTNIETRDCMTVVPAAFGTKLNVTFENVTFDGLTAYQSVHLNDHHLLQLMHGAEVTLSGVTIQNFDIAAGCPSNGVVSLDGRTTVADGGCHLVMNNGTVIKDCNSNMGTPYNTGGIAVNSSTLDMHDATIEDCSSRGGPAILVDNTSVATLHSGALIQNCHAINEGGAIRNSGTLNLEDGSAIKNCTPQSGGAVLGGAVWNKGTVNISGGEISGCSAYQGGAIYNADGTVYISGGTITGNTAAEDTKSYRVPATMGSAIFQDGTMYLSGAPEFDGNQDVYLPEGRVITKNGEITAASKVPIVLENEPRYRDILVSQDKDDCVVSKTDRSKLDVKLSSSATTPVEGTEKALGAVYSETGLDSAASPTNVVELDVSESLEVTKVWGDTKQHDPITVKLYKNGESDPVDQLRLSEATQWKGTFTGLEVAADGTLPYFVEEVPVENYSCSVSSIEYVPLEKPAYWVPVSSNTFSSGEFVIYGGNVALSHNGQTLKAASPVLTNESITLNGRNYSNYFTADQITDNEIWTATGSSSRLTTKDGYRLDYNSSSIRLSTSATDTWSISGGKLRQGTGTSSYVVLPNLTTGNSTSGTAVQLYQRVEGPEAPPHYGVTITNTMSTSGNKNIAADLHKQIDYLGDGVTNPDTSASGDDLYRLYLDVTTSPEAVDLLIIADCSNSMNDVTVYGSNPQRTALLDGESRYTVLDRIINGTPMRNGRPYTTVNSNGVNDATKSVAAAESADRAADGLVYEFLNANTDNHIALIGYGNTTDVRRTWASKSDLSNGGANTKDYFVNVRHENSTRQGDIIESGTNYMLALKDAKEQLLDKTTAQGGVSDSGRKKVLVFMTDGEANHYVNIGSDGSYTKVTGSLTESASNANSYLKNTIMSAYPDLEVYVVGISDEVTSGEVANQLRNMASLSNGQFYPCNNASAFKDSMMEVVDKQRLVPTSIVDRLSEYVDFADPLDMKVTMSDKDGSNTVPLWENGASTSRNVWKNGTIIQSVSAENGQVSVIFDPNLVMDTDKKFVVSFNIAAAEEASVEGPDRGDEGTDYGTNATSSEQKGFYSNVSAYVATRVQDTHYIDAYPHPVVQLPAPPPPPVDLPIRKWVEPVGNGAYDLSLLAQIPQYSESTTPGSSKLDVLLAIDTTMSMGRNFDGTNYGSYERWNALTTAIGTMLDAFRTNNADARVAVIGFSGEGGYASATGSNRYADAGCIMNWTYDYNSVANRINGLTGSTYFQSSTNYEAPFYLLNNSNLFSGTRSDARKVVLFISDGEPNRYYSAQGESLDDDDAFWGEPGLSLDNAETQVRALFGWDSLYAIGVSDDAGLNFLTSLVSNAVNIPVKDAYSCQNEQQLIDALLDAVATTGTQKAETHAGVWLEDTLSDNVQPVADATLTLTATEKDGTKHTATGTITEGAVLQLNATNLNANGGTLRAAYDSGTKRITVSSDADYVFESEWTYQVTTQIKPTQQAEEAYAATSDYPNVGEPDTGSASSEQPGFWSNTEGGALLYYTVSGQEYTKNFPRPVVQIISTFDIHLRKVAAEDTSLALTGAEFDLYAECARTDPGSAPVPGMENTYWRKVNTAPLVSTATENITVENLSSGRYYLVETKAPDGYLRLQEPIPFVLSADGITSADSMVMLNDADTFIVCIKNTAGYELPKTGGIGTHVYTLCGIAFMAATLMCGLSMKRRREGRGD